MTLKTLLAGLIVASLALGAGSAVAGGGHHNDKGHGGHHEKHHGHAHHKHAGHHYPHYAYHHGRHHGYYHPYPRVRVPHGYSHRHLSFIYIN